MSNYLKMEKKQMLLSLRKPGWSFRRREREAGIRWETIITFPRKSGDTERIEIKAENCIKEVCNERGKEKEV